MTVQTACRHLVLEERNGKKYCTACHAQIYL